MNQREIGFTQGVGWAITYMVKDMNDRSLGESLAQESGITLKDFEKVCDEYDLNYIRKVLK